MSTNWVYVLEGEPKDVVIVDKDGNKRHPNLEAVKKKPRLDALPRGGAVSGATAAIRRHQGTLSA